MSPKWFRRVKELFQDGFVGGRGLSESFARGAPQSVRKALKNREKAAVFA
jgi:hypothetical protein